VRYIAVKQISGVSVPLAWPLPIDHDGDEGRLAFDQVTPRRKRAMGTTEAAESLILSPDMAGTLMTPEEFDLAELDPDDASRYELIHGVLIVTPIPSEGEADPNETLGYLLRKYQEMHAQGSILNKTLPERHIFGTNRRRADRVIWAGLGRLPNPRQDAPTIVVEFVSKGRRNRRRDYVEKRQEYEALGVQEYWVIDRFQRTMTVFGQKVSATGERVIGENDIYTTPLLPGFELPLALLFAAADDWK
jgi:Uma2 family endonuclease